MSFRKYCLDSVKQLEATAEYVPDVRVEDAIDVTARALNASKGLLVCGNGGSASDAMHITGELVGRFLRERRALKAICLSSNPSVITAWSNDYGYDTVFARQVEAYGESGGVILGLSTSGNSLNVVKAFQVAKRIGMTTIGMTGQGGGKLSLLSDILLDVPSKSTPAIQQIHICLYHYFCEMVEERCAHQVEPIHGQELLSDVQGNENT